MLHRHHLINPPCSPWDGSKQVLGIGFQLWLLPPSAQPDSQLPTCSPFTVDCNVPRVHLWPIDTLESGQALIAPFWTAEESVGPQLAAFVCLGWPFQGLFSHSYGYFFF